MHATTRGEICKDISRGEQRSYQEVPQARVPLKDVTATQSRLAPDGSGATVVNKPMSPRKQVSLRRGPRIVSLGSYCGVRKSVQKAGLDDEALPFDWMRTRVEGVLHYLRNDFDGFFNFVTTHDLQNTVVMYRDHLHSFWHDDLPDPQCKEKYMRRIERLNGLDARTEPILFIRSVSHTKELLYTDELLQEVISRFGERAMLMVIVDFQVKTVGPTVVQNRDNLLVYFSPTKAHSEPNGAPYGDPIQAALEWMDGRLEGALVLPSVDSLLDHSNISTGWTIEGLEPFEDLSSTASTCSGRTHSHRTCPSTSSFSSDAATVSSHVPTAASVPTPAPVLRGAVGAAGVAQPMLTTTTTAPQTQPLWTGVTAQRHHPMEFGSYGYGGPTKRTVVLQAPAAPRAPYTVAAAPSVRWPVAVAPFAVAAPPPSIRRPVVVTTRR